MVRYPPYEGMETLLFGDRAMINVQARPARWGLWALMLAALLATDVLAQTAVQRPTVAVVATADMQLWSFGECDRRFPYVDSDQHKDCVQVVGSAEAKDARALRVCELSHEKDTAEIERCKSAYQANKERAAQDGVVPDTPAMPQAAPSEEMMRRVQVIKSAAVEQNKAAAAAAAPPADTAGQEATARTAEPETSSSMMTIGIASLAVLLLGVGAMVARRKQGETAEPEGVHTAPAGPA